MTETRPCLHCALFPTRPKLLVARRVQRVRGVSSKVMGLEQIQGLEGLSTHGLTYQEHDFPCMHDRRPANASSPDKIGSIDGNSCGSARCSSFRRPAASSYGSATRGGFSLHPPLQVRESNSRCTCLFGGGGDEPPAAWYAASPRTVSGCTRQGRTGRSFPQWGHRSELKSCFYWYPSHLEVPSLEDIYVQPGKQ